MILISLSRATPENRLNVDSAEAKIKINSIIILEHQLTKILDSKETHINIVKLFVSVVEGSILLLESTEYDIHSGSLF